MPKRWNWLTNRNCLNDSFPALLKKTIEKDRALERTTAGIHRDDLQFVIHGMPMKKIWIAGAAKIIFDST